MFKPITKEERLKFILKGGLSDGVIIATKLRDITSISFSIVTIDSENNVWVYYKNNSSYIRFSFSSDLEDFIKIMKDVSSPVLIRIGDFVSMSYEELDEIYKYLCLEE